MDVHAGEREGAQRRGFIYLDADGERTITILGARLVPHGADPLPWDRARELDGIYFTGGDADALRAARQAKVIVATPRADRTLVESGVQIDVLVHSGTDPGEAVQPEDLDPPPRTVVTTLGAKGGRWDGELGTGTGGRSRSPGRGWTPTARVTRSPPG